MQETAFFFSKCDYKKDTLSLKKKQRRDTTKKGYNREGVQRGERETSEFFNELIEYRIRTTEE